jgi:pantoate--beta-alanine ligase
LSGAERAEAPRLYRLLNSIKERIHQGEKNVLPIEKDALNQLQQAGWKPDYIAIRRRSDLKAVTAEQMAAGEPLVVLAAAKLGATRLIDNLEI